MTHPPITDEMVEHNASIPDIVRTLMGDLEIQSSQTEIFSRKMMEFKTECDRLRAANHKLCAANKELREVAQFYVKWGESQIKPCPWDVGRMHNRARIVLGFEPLDLLSATKWMVEREARAALEAALSGEKDDTR